MAGRGIGETPKALRHAWPSAITSGCVVPYVRHCIYGKMLGGSLSYRLFCLIHPAFFPAEKRGIRTEGKKSRLAARRRNMRAAAMHCPRPFLS